MVGMRTNVAKRVAPANGGSSMLSLLSLGRFLAVQSHPAGGLPPSPPLSLPPPQPSHRLPAWPWPGTSLVAVAALGFSRQ